MTGTTRRTPRQPKVDTHALYTPLPWQIAPWRDRSPLILLTGSAGGGKSRLAAEKLHGFCLKYPGATALLVRKARVSITNSTAELLKRGVISSGDRTVRHVPSKSRFDYDNGSLLLYTGLDDEEQRERLRSIGAEGGVDIAWMEEATEFDEPDLNAVDSRIRGVAATWRQTILSCNPDAPTHWIYRRLILGREAKVYYSRAADNTYNPPDYLDRLDRLTGIDRDRLALGQWIQASGIVYDVWSDGPIDGNVTEAAVYIPGGGDVLWSVDDGYSGALDQSTNQYTANSHPRVFGLYQLRHDGTIVRFAEHYRTQTLSEQHIADVLALPYPAPEYAVVDSSAAELRGRLQELGIGTYGGTHTVEEGIKVTRRFLAPDANGRRRFLVNPTCVHFRAEMASYRYDAATGKPVKQFDHGPDEARMLCWKLRYD